MPGEKRLLITAFGALILTVCPRLHSQDDLKNRFHNPPDSARPGVYWYFMDGNRTRQGMTADLESMKAAGIGNLIFLEVNVGVPRGPIDFLSEPWQEMFVHGVREAERLGIEITLGSGPGWAGSGGPWVTPNQSMQHLVAASVPVHGPKHFHGVLPRPAPRAPYFGEQSVPPTLRKLRAAYYNDVAVLAFPTPRNETRIKDIDEKALYYRAPYSSRPGVKPYLPAPANLPTVPADAKILPDRITDLTGKLDRNGTLDWNVPEGDWTIMRFGRRNNGATTRPAPEPGFGFECDKMDSDAFDAHFAAYIGKLIRRVGKRSKDGAGWTMLHIDSWEMGAQNWTKKFRTEFHRRRGYDLLPFLPTYTGRIVGSLEQSERFLWDVRLTAQQLVLANHAEHLKKLGRKHGFGLSIEPYDMNPTSDLELGSVADVPMCEFWSEGVGFNTAYSCIEAVSVAHTQGRPIVAAEAFTADSREGWTRYPGAIKNQGDWAFCTGINRFVYHTFAHKPQGRRPGMTMGPYGVHWDRGQTWWPMASAYHRYITRCQFLLRQGLPVADICYLIPEGAPHVFRPPPSALQGSGSMPDHRGYNFDGCAPGTLIKRASVHNGRVVFPNGAAYRLLVLPAFDTMTPKLLDKIEQLVKSGATVIGPPPHKSPSLEGYPECDRQVRAQAVRLWGTLKPAKQITRRRLGNGELLWGGQLYVPPPGTSVKRIIEQAKWIWYPENHPEVAAKPGTRYFRRIWDLDLDKRIQSARVEITADNAFELSVNGHTAVTGNNFHAVYSADVGNLLTDSRNIVTVSATNTGNSANPAGLIASLRIQYKDGSIRTLVTDHYWMATRSVTDTWRTDPQLDAGWTNAQELGPALMAPWNLKIEPEQCPNLYPAYATTARLLARMGVPTDFESDKPVRYTHRQIGTTDLYFVSNRTADVINARCRFRTSGRQPELWDPLGGSIRNLPDFRAEQSLTTVPLRFEPYQSFFIVFRKPAAEGHRTTPRIANFSALNSIQSIAGPWHVSFDPGSGGPGHVVFGTLENWTQRPEPGIQYYSGIAIYDKTFDLPDSLRPNKETILLDLGVVRNMARVRLNGHDLGVVWCAPWRVDISQAVRTSGNKLQIEIANLWANRLIGDKSLPPKQRVTWTTFDPYKANSPLLPSGLLGPVTIKTKRDCSMNSGPALK